MKKISQIAFLSLIAFLILLPQTTSITIPYSDPKLIYYGRYYTDSNGVRYDWPCTTIQFCFINARQVWWLGEDTFGHYGVQIQGKRSYIMIPKDKKKVIIFNGTATDQTTCMKIVKITQDHFGPLGTKKDALFKGLQLQGNNPSLVYKQNNFTYKLQFVGDSLTAAYGDMSGTNIKCFFRMRHNQNCMHSWATVLSNKLNAEYRIEAQSGKGIIKNSKMVPGKVMPQLFTQITCNSKSNSYHYQDKYSPDAVLIFLGINDHNSFIRPKPSSFIFAYQKFLNTILIMQPDKTKKTKLILLCSGDFPKQVCQYVKTVVDSFKYAYQFTYYVQVPKGIFVKGNMGCISHPNVQGQREIAEAIYLDVKNILDN